MRIATWNVNSIRARQERLFTWLRRHAPDVLCLQELKVEEAKYPRAELAALGYESAICAQKTYNGVAILSRTPITDVVCGLVDGVDDAQARLVAGTVRGVRVVNVYCPNGQTVGSDKWFYKLAWMKRLRAWLDRHETPERPLVLCGDFNVAPEPIDVHDPAAWEKETLFHPEARGSLRYVTDFGLVDTFRSKHPGVPNAYSWWDYRMLGFQKGKGLRIDHVFATKVLAESLVASHIDREERKGESPSDHAPVVSTFDVGTVQVGAFEV